ncbi:uncharacterized protein LOC128983382 isoform X2 [Macrosteles quadrilineatus]|uniref:uncharacterized protein LOC128983382 isoform X2 n=1 Tax=Macrosteles quadrilineatus TaxID=74068 RepID=UPI0023E348FC|nr:uncharacterized protein LOC128983382 isoform X2 [Macrosteles quadrilineatus]
MSESEDENVLQQTEQRTVSRKTENFTMVPCNLQNFNFEGNLAENWKHWYQKFEIYLLASNLNSENDARKVALLLHNLGDKCIDIFNSFNLSSEDAKKYDVVVSKFENHFSPKKNLTVLRHKFLNRKQLPSESIDSFYTDLVNLSLACEFDSVRESLVCDVLISGLNSQNQNVRERLLREPEINLEKTLAICKAAELSKQHIRELEAEHNVYTVNVHKQRERGYQQPQTFRQKQVHQDQRNKFHPPSQQKSTGTGSPLLLLL